MTKRQSQQVAYAVVELTDVRDDPVSGADVSDAPKRLDHALARLDQAAAAPGLSVAEAAVYLQVSEPTVRDRL
jgi:hypothetical protein